MNLDETALKYPLSISDVLIPHEIIPKFMRPLIRLPVCELTVNELVDKVYERGTVDLDFNDTCVYRTAIGWRHPFYFHGGNYETTVSVNECQKMAKMTIDKITNFYRTRFGESWPMFHKNLMVFARSRRNAGYPVSNWDLEYRRIDDRCYAIYYDSVDDIMSDDIMVGHITKMTDGLDAIRRWYHAAW